MFLLIQFLHERGDKIVLHNFAVRQLVVRFAKKCCGNRQISAENRVAIILLGNRLRQQRATRHARVARRVELGLRGFFGNDFSA